MALFSSLSEKMNHIFSKLTKRGRLTELEIKEAMREIRVALLEADVNYTVAKNFIASVSEKAVGEKVLTSLTPGQQVIKIVNEELTNLMGKEQSKLVFASKPPTILMMCGLQGAGKTTMSGKLASYLKQQGKKVLLVACDIYRPAAIEQLKVVGKQSNTQVFEKGTQSPVKTAKQAIEYASSYGFDVVIVDTAGRLHINEELMIELQEIKEAICPTEILLTVDSMTGQDAVNVAQTFNEKLDITGVILTKLDGDTRGGVALSIKQVIGKPIKFCGIGEKMGDIEPFYPDRMASRILGMGDVLSLIEKAQQAITEDEAKKLEEQFRKNNFTFEDYLAQVERLKKMGNIKDLIGMIPGMRNKLGGALKDFDDSIIDKNKAIIQSMTKQERMNPNIINGSRKKRIALGSGTTIQEVNALLKQYEQTKEMMKQFNKKKGLFKF